MSRIADRPWREPPSQERIAGHIAKIAESDEVAEPDKWGIANAERFDRL